MLKTYTEIIGSEMPIYTKKPSDKDVEFYENIDKSQTYELIGYLLVDVKNDLYKGLYILN